MPAEFGPKFDIGVTAITPPEYENLGDSDAIQTQGRMDTNPHVWNFYRRKGKYIGSTNE